MSYEVFQQKVNALVKRAGGGLKVRFSHDDGKHYARCSDGTVIVGNSVAVNVMVRWGSGHTSHATI